jgi:signal transduction histidine kinase/DNA-binding response OmpR family regulator
VRAANKDGVWNEAERSLTVRILPPWWATLWARLLYALLAITLVASIVRLRGDAQRRYAQSLEREVAQRTREVEHQKQVIENILSRRNELFENVSHEFRTPLTLMIGPLEQLERDLEQKDAPAKIELALTNAKRLLRMVEQLLTLSEVTADTAMPQRARPLRPVVYMQLAAFAQAAQENGIDLVAGEMPDDSVLISQDGLETILGNLISNAIKYSGRGSCVRVEARRLDDWIEILVEDNGPGINAEDAEHVFQRFGRLRHHASVPGSGLGLAVTKEVVEANGGSIRCERGSEGGAAFVIRLPRCDAALPVADYVESQRVLPRAVHDTWIEPTAADIEAFVDDPAAPVEESGRKRVLVIDDSPDILAYVGDVLAPHFDISRANNGQEGIERASADVPDAIICDIMMPDMDGYEVSQDLRSNEVTSHIPILLLTARGDRDSRLRAWTETADEYLQKPFDAEELRLRLQNLMSIRDMLRANLSRQLDKDADLSSMELQGKDLEFMQRLDSVVSEGYAGLTFNRAAIALGMAISERQLQRKLKALTGRNPSVYLRDFRLRAAKEQLLDGAQVALVSERCGFSSASYFVKCFREKYGTTPKKYQSESVARSRA